MDEDTPSFVMALIINIIVFIVIPLVMTYRRGYFFNSDEHFNWIKRVFKRKNQYLQTEVKSYCNNNIHKPNYYSDMG